MDYARPIMWNVPEWAEITLYCLIPLVLLAFAAGVAWRVGNGSSAARAGRRDPRARLIRILDPARLTEWVSTALFQGRLSSDTFSLVMHLAIFWGMVVLAIGTALATVDQDFTNLLLDSQILRGGFYCLFKLALDIFGVVLIVGVLHGRVSTLSFSARTTCTETKRHQPVGRISLPDVPVLHRGHRVCESRASGWRRGFTWKRAPRRRRRGLDAKHEMIDDLGFAHAATWAPTPGGPVAPIAQGGPVFPAAPWAPVGYGLASFWPRCLWIDPRTASSPLVLHAILAFALMICIPFTKAFHLISSPANMLLRGPGPRVNSRSWPTSGVARCGISLGGNCSRSMPARGAASCHAHAPPYHCGFPLSPRDWSRPSIGSSCNGDQAERRRRPALHYSRSSSRKRSGPAPPATPAWKPAPSASSTCR